MLNKDKNQKGRILTKETNIRLDLYLFNYFNLFSRTKIKNHILKGNILVNNDKTSPSYILKGNENISYDFTITVKTRKLIPQDINFGIIYEDEYLVIINKPSGLVVHPGSGIKDGTLANGLIYKFKNLSNINVYAPGIVHRLDKDTSGLMIIAKNDEVHANLSKQFESRVIAKILQIPRRTRFPLCSATEGGPS